MEKKAAYRNEFLDSYTIVSSTRLIHTNVWGPKHRLQEKYLIVSKMTPSM